MSLKKLLLILAITLFSLFVFYSYLVAKEKFVSSDFDTTVKFQDKISHRFDYPFSVISVIGSVEITGAIWLVIFLFFLYQRYFLTALTMFSLPLALVIEVFGKTAVFHPAPPMLFYRGVIKYNFPSNFVHTDFSYPSGHTLRLSYLLILISVVFLLRADRKYQIFIQPLIAFCLILVCVSRIYLGEHWTSDVVGGLLLGSSLSIISALSVPIKRINPVQLDQ